LSAKYTRTGHNRDALDFKQEWRAIRAGNERQLSAVLLGGNGTTGFGKVKAGTVLGRITSSSKVRPAGMQAALDAGAAAVEMDVLDASNFYVADSIEVRSAAGAYDAVTVVGGDDPSNITFTATAKGDSRIRVAIVVAGVGTAFSYTIQDDGTNIDVTFNSATDGGGLATTTTGTIEALVNGAFAWLMTASAETGADLVAAVAATALTGGVAVGEKLFDGTVAAVDKTASPNTVTLSAAATWAIGDIVLHDDGSAYPVGILEDEVTTTSYAATGEDEHVTMGVDGTFYPTKVIGLNGDAVMGLALHETRVDDLVSGSARNLEHFGFRSHIN
jgi:hypothetical protein